MLSCVLMGTSRYQVAVVRRQAAAKGCEGLEVLTIDRCQGRDAAAVLVSLAITATPASGTGKHKALQICCCDN